MVERLKLLNDGVVGVGGNVSEDRVGEARLVARWIGRNMPEPGIEVVKYRTLYHISLLEVGLCVRNS